MEEAFFRAGKNPKSNLTKDFLEYCKYICVVNYKKFNIIRFENLKARYCAISKMYNSNSVKSKY